MTKKNERTKQNRWLRTRPGGEELVEAICAINTIGRKLNQQAENGDPLADEKVTIANVAMEKLEAVRNAMLADGEWRKQTPKVDSTTDEVDSATDAAS